MFIDITSLPCTGVDKDEWVYSEPSGWSLEWGLCTCWWCSWLLNVALCGGFCFCPYPVCLTQLSSAYEPCEERNIVPHRAPAMLPAFHHHLLQVEMPGSIMVAAAAVMSWIGFSAHSVSVVASVASSVTCMMGLWHLRSKIKWRKKLRPTRLECGSYLWISDSGLPLLLQCIVSDISQLLKSLYFHSKWASQVCLELYLFSEILSAKYFGKKCVSPLIHSFIGHLYHCLWFPS